MEIIQKLGELCHKHYKGCDMKTGDWQYSYDTEVIEMLESDEAIEIIQQEIDRADLELLKKIINKEGSDEESRLVILAQEFVRLTKLNNKDK